MAEPSGQRTRRWETLIGPANARDLGGYATVDGRVTRWGQLWRSDSLHCLDDAGVAELVRGGVRTVLDLRNTHEAREFPVRVGEHVRYVHMPLRFGEPILSLGSLYRSMVDDYGEDLRAILGQLAEPGALPALFHCAVGKDRTGVVSALLLGVAGVPHATIAEDYALSAGYLAGPFADALRRRSEANGGDAGHGSIAPCAARSRRCSDYWRTSTNAGAGRSLTCGRSACRQPRLRTCATSSSIPDAIYGVVLGRSSPGRCPATRPSS